MRRKTKEITFEQNPKGILGYLSNHYLCTFYEDGISFPSVEHYFQAYKFQGKPYFDIIRTAPTAEKAKEYGRTNKLKLRPNWDSIREDIMRNALRLKFSQNLKLREALKDTRTSPIVFDNEDTFWGNGSNGRGDNLLGEALVAIREELKNL